MTLAALGVVPGTLLANSGPRIASSITGSYVISSPPKQVLWPPLGTLSSPLPWLLSCIVMICFCLCHPYLNSQGWVESELISVRAVGRMQLELDAVKRHWGPLENRVRNAKFKHRVGLGTRISKIKEKPQTLFKGSVLTVWHICRTLLHSHIYLQTSKIRCFGIFFGLHLVTNYHYLWNFQKRNFNSNNHNNRKKYLNFSFLKSCIYS